METASMPLEVKSMQPADARGCSGGGERRRSHLPPLDAFSPVNENGSFEFDRVLKSGKVLRRSKNKHSFKASWKPCYMVLRPNLLSVYKDEDEAQLQMSIAASDISAVALVKAPKSKRPNVFGIFSPAKNYRFQAASAEDTDSWIHHIRSEFPATQLDTVDHGQGAGNRIVTVEESAYETSDHEGHAAPSGNPRALRAIPINPPARDSLRSRDTNEVASCSELSDIAGHPASFRSMASFPASPVSPAATAPRPGIIRRDASQHSDIVGPTQLEAEERVIFQGYLQCLKTIKGVRQWKKYWIVLRPRSLYFYKNNQEYRAISIISMDTVISAAEIDPISRSRPYCFQVIAEDKAHRFSAPDEETLDKWLGSLTSVLIKMHGAVHNPVAGVALGAK